MTQLDTATNRSTSELTRAGVSIWLDDINRENLTDGKLARLIAEKNVVGVTTNPTIFAGALSKGNAYDAQMQDLQTQRVDVKEALFQITTRDVGDAADLFHDIYAQTRGYDGRVSIEVTPANAYDAAATAEEAVRLWDTLARPNIMIKIPATVAGLDAIRQTIARGISINVTLIFGLARYCAVIDAYLDGLEAAAAAGIDLAGIHSVASFFISRVDAEVNKRLADAPQATREALHNKVGVANARLAYQVFQQAFATDRARDLLDRGANYQRPLWASTGVKSDDLPDTYYVTELIAPQTVNTMPDKTLAAVADHGEITGDTITYRYEAAEHTLAMLATAGIDINEVTEALEKEGVSKFIASWQEFGDTVQRHLGD